MRRIVIELSDKEVEIGKGIHMTLVEQASPSEEELCRKVIQEVKRQCDMPEQHFISIEPELKTIKDMEILQELVDELKRQAEPGENNLIEDMKTKLWEFIQYETENYQMGQIDHSMIEYVPEALRSLIELIKLTPLKYRYSYKKGGYQHEEEGKKEAREG